MILLILLGLLKNKQKKLKNSQHSLGILLSLFEFISIVILLFWDMAKVADIFHMIFLNEFCWQFYLFIYIQISLKILPKSPNSAGNGLTANGWQAITRNNDDPVHCHRPQWVNSVVFIKTFSWYWLKHTKMKWFNSCLPFEHHLLFLGISYHWNYKVTMIAASISLEALTH